MKPIPFTPKGEQFKPGMRVRILEGPFADFRGIIQKVDPLQEKAVVTVNFYMKEVIAEFRFSQITQHGV